MAITLQGTVRTQDNEAVEKASVQLVAPAEPLRGLKAAAVRRPGAVSWTRTISGFSGHRWNCWQKLVMNVVAGITWDEFEAQVVAYNPVLADDGYVFRADKTYRLPEQASGSPVILWSRPLAGFQGTRWQCWVDHVRGKVEGITWDEFVEVVVEFNPSLREDGYVFRDDKTYVLPENLPAPDEIAWTRSLSGLIGNRWQCWEAHVRDQVQGITWSEFMTGVVERNPVLREDGYVFLASKTYLLPENPATPVYYVHTVTDGQGRYAFTELTTPGNYRLIVEAEGCFRYHDRLSLQADMELDVTLVVKGARMASQWEGYATAPEEVRRLIDQALSMLGDDPIAFDALPADLRRLATGSYFPDPNHLRYKDIVCADLVSICLHAAGVDHDWPVTEPAGTPFVSSHAANYYRPRADHPKLRVVAEDEEWLPGDILIYWDGNLPDISLNHVNLYVGPYSGTDLNGTVHPPARGYDVVNASVNYLVGGIEYGTDIRPATKAYCTGVRYHYEHVMRLRHVELERTFTPGARAILDIGAAGAAAAAASTTALQGKGVWSYRRTELDRAIEISPHMGATHVIYKVAKGAAYREGMAEAAQAIRDAGLVPLAYAYPLLDDPQGEAEVVVKAFQDGFEGLIFDLEASQCRNRFEEATRLGQFLRVAGIDLQRLYNCSYPNISHHRDLPYDPFNEFCKGGLMPMSYGTFYAPGSTVPPEAQVKRVIDEWTYGHYELWAERWGYHPPLYPVLGPYHDEQGTVRMGPDEFQVWLDGLAAHGPSFFSVFTAAVIDEALLPLIRACPLARTPEPEPLRVRVESPDSGTLRIRRTPSTELPPLTRVEHKTLLTPLEPEEAVRAKVGKVEEWLHIVTPDGVEGYAYAWYLRLHAKEAAPPIKLVVLGPDVASLNVHPDPSTARLPLTQVDDDDLLEALEPADEVMAKVGQPEEWLLIRTPAGIEGYVAAGYVHLYEEPVAKVYSHLSVRSSGDLNVRPGPGTQNPETWRVGNRTTLQALEEPTAVASKIGRDSWIHVRTPSLHEGYVNGLYVRPMERVDDRKAVSPGSVRKGECPWIFGLHAAEPGTQTSDYRSLFQDKHKTGWVLFNEAIGTDPTYIQRQDFSQWSDQGFGVLMRLNNGWGKAGTLPVHTEYEGFADTCARYAALAEGCHIWIIGNEPNNIREHPGGEAHPVEHITPERYAQAFNLARARIKAEQPEAVVVPGAVYPYLGSTWPLLGRPYRPMDYFKEMMALIDDLDGISLHTYTHWLDPSLITSLKPFDDDPLTPKTPDEHYYHFQAYRAFAEAIPCKWHDRPIYITETNHRVQSTVHSPNAENGWLDEDRGWVRAAYAEIDRWNRSHYAQQIYCLLLYRWTGDAWGFENLYEVKKDLQAALDNDYRWRR
jgi:hypothetical protein